jgi:hypothetical protein
MNTVTQSSRLTIAASAVLAALLTSTSAFAATGVAVATFVKGTVEVGTAEAGPFKKLKRNGDIPPGSFVKTGDESRAELKFTDGSILRLGPASVLKVEAGAFDATKKEVKVDATLVGGKAWANVSKLVGSESKFEVRSANAVAGVRGTVFRINVERDAATVVKVYDGAVAVSNSPFFADSGQKASLEPIDPNRRQIAAPFQEISKKEWEQVVARMMEVRVGKDGTMDTAAPFTAEKDKVEDPEWVNWNLACDKGSCDAY